MTFDTNAKMEDNIYLDYIFDNKYLNFREKAIMIARRPMYRYFDFDKYLKHSKDRRDSLKKIFKVLDNPYPDSYYIFRENCIMHGHSELWNEIVFDYFNIIIDDKNITWRAKGIAMYMKFYSEEVYDYRSIGWDTSENDKWVRDGILELINQNYVIFQDWFNLKIQ